MICIEVDFRCITVVQAAVYFALRYYQKKINFNNFFHNNINIYFQGVHYQCSEGHLFHWECSLPFVPLLIAFGSDGISSLVDQPAPPKGTITDLYNAEPGCPHCGLDQDTLEPVNLECFKVNLEMSCSNPVIFLPNPRLQWC